LYQDKLKEKHMISLIIQIYYIPMKFGYLYLKQNL
jgi:hypothetical protein